MDRGYLSLVLPRACRRLARGGSRVAGGNAAVARPEDTTDREGNGPARRGLAPLARGGSLRALVLLSSRQETRGRTTAHHEKESGEGQRKRKQSDAKESHQQETPWRLN